MRRSPLFATLGLLLAAAICARLGVWQLARAEAAERHAQAVAARGALPYLALPPETGEPYRNAVARGRFDTAHPVRIDGRRQAGRVGHHLLLPLALEGSERRLLVNLGWLEADAAVAFDFDRPVAVRGLLVPPQQPALRLGQPAGAGTVPWLDLDAVAAVNGAPVESLVLVADATLAEELRRGAAARGERASMHTGYALQWFAFGLMALGLLWPLWRGVRREA